MKLDPQTTVGSLLRAIPSSALVFERLGITVGQSEGENLQEVCTRHGISLEEFLRAMDEIDWNEEGSSRRLSASY